MRQVVFQIVGSEKLTKTLSVILAVLFIVALFTIPTHHKVGVGL